MPSITIKSAHAELWRYRLEKPIGGSGLKQIDIIVVELQSADINGMGFSYVLGGGGDQVLFFTRELLDRFLMNRRIEHPAPLWREIVASFNRLGRGPNNLALAGIDLAVWDLFARSLEVPLGVALGGRSRAVPVYVT